MGENLLLYQILAIGFAWYRAECALIRGCDSCEIIQFDGKEFVVRASRGHPVQIYERCTEERK